MSRTLVLAALAALLAPTAARAQTCTTSWTNPAGGPWETAANWDAGLPDGADTACITLAGTYTVTSTTTTDRAVAGLVLGGASGTQTLQTRSAFTVAGDAVVRPNGRWELLNRTPGGADGIYMGGTLLVEGALVQNSGTTLLDGGGTLDVAPGGTWQMLTGASAGVPSRPGTYRLRGTLDGSCAATCNVQLPLRVESGTVRVSAGTLDINAGGTLHNTTLDAPAGTTLRFDDVNASGGALVVTGTLSGTPAGTVVVSTLRRFAAGAGDATLAVGGTGLRFDGSSGLAYTSVQSAGGRFINTGLLVWNSFAYADAVVIENRATFRAETSVPLRQGSVLRNLAGATVHLPATAGLSGDGRLDNAGLLLRDGATGTSNLNGLLRSLPGSEIRSNVDRLDLSAPGSRSIPEGTTLTGTGTFGLPRDVDIEGAVSPGTAAQPVATLTLHSFRPSQAAGSPRLILDVDAGAQSDRIAVPFSSGSPAPARLAGTLVVRVRPGYTPAVGDAFTILTSARVVEGAFAQVVAEGAPAGVAFVAETAGDGLSVVLRAVATAPGGAITVSTTQPVGGGVRPVFLTGPGVVGVSAARLVCTSCLDPGAFGTIPAVLVGSGTLVEARFDLTSPRAFGLYDLVVQRPGHPDEVVPVTVRPYLSFVLASDAAIAGMRTRPPGQGYNWSHLQMRNRTNAPEPAFPLQFVERPVPELVSLALGTGNPFTGGQVFYQSDTAPDPLAPPLVIGRVPAGQTVRLVSGLRISPEDVLFPGQVPTGPDDPRIPFGQGRSMFVLGAFHASFSRTTATVETALRATGHAGLADYLADVDAANPAAVGGAVRGAVTYPAGGYYTVAFHLLDRVLGMLQPTAPVPAGLAAAAATAFDAALKAAADAHLQVMQTALADIEAGPADVRALYEAELAAVLPELADPFAAGGGGVAEGTQGWACDNADGVANVYDQIRRDEEARTGSSGGPGTCQPPRGPVDPNDKTADVDLRCEFGVVDVGGEPVTRCVRYYVPLARAAEPIGYTVAFENLATATEPAEFVTITDELDPSLNPATLEVLGTSSDSTFSYSVSGQTVTFRFTGINLPPNVTAPEGQGYVRFRVSPTGPLPDGTEIRNDASIVFDFNPPIVTPEVLHEVQQTADVATVVAAPDFVEVGAPFAFEVAVSNLHGDPAAEVTVVIATGAAVASATPTVGTCAGTGPVTCSLGTMAEGAFETVAVVLAAPPVGEYTLASTASTTSFDAFAANDTDAVTAGVVGVAVEDESGFPRELTVGRPWPNPSRGPVNLRWGLPQTGWADVRVYDLLGREVARLADSELTPAGWHEVRWDAAVASGVYVVRLRVGEETRSRRLTILR